MNQTLESIRGQISIIDNMSVHAKTQAEHDRRLKEVLKKLESAEATLYTGKCEFSKENSSLPDMFPTKMKNLQLGEERFHPHHRSFPKCE